jgi:hypothetical protein
MGRTSKPKGVVVVAPPEGAAARPHRYRSDGWTPRKRQQFLEVLRREASLREAARAVGLSKTSVTRLRDKDPEFDRQCETALAAIRPSLLETAYQRAVIGIEEPVFQGGKQVGTRRKVSDSMLRLLIDRGVDPNCAPGGRGTSTISGRYVPTDEEVLAALHKKLTAMEKRIARQVGEVPRLGEGPQLAEGRCPTCGTVLRVIEHVPDVVDEVR